MAKLILTKTQTDAVTAMEKKYVQEEKTVGEKYTQVLRKPEGEFEVEIHEYVTPTKEPGYQKLYYITKEDVNYYSSVGFGSEAKTRTFDWLEIIED